MQYALVTGKRSPAKKGIQGQCESCGAIVIAKCGDVKLHHWAHLSKKDCDHWWEPETVWHRNWKNQFPEKFREVSFLDEGTKEVHQADLHTDKGITVEFQNSSINPIERASREKFYKNLVWVVNGTRLKNDFSRFENAQDRFVFVSQGIYRLDYSDECFPKTWVGSSVPVIFDFLGSLTGEPLLLKEPLYCLIPAKLGQYAIVVKISRNNFIQVITNGQWLVWINSLIKDIHQVNQEKEIQEKTRHTAQLNSFLRPNHNRRQRRW